MHGIQLAYIMSGMGCLLKLAQSLFYIHFYVESQLFDQPLLPFNSIFFAISVSFQSSGIDHSTDFCP